MAQAVTGSGDISAEGGKGARATGGLAGGAGGGGGGRIKIVSQVGTEVTTVDGGRRGNSDTPDDDAVDGADGTVDVSYNIDDDGDGIPSDVDNCVIDDNPDQNDTDGDGTGDICDDCPDDPAIFTDNNDGDNDGVADSCDICLLGDDSIDSDNDTVPDACDLCPGGLDLEDADLDGAPDDCDNCYGLHNPDQLNEDEDPYGAACDCDDLSPAIFRGAPEVCDGVDNDCDGIPDGPNAEGQTSYHPDFDRDGFGNEAVTKIACSPPLNYIEDGTDCNDGSAHSNPISPEICDGVDNDCDDLVDEELKDCNLDTGLDDKQRATCSCAVNATNPANILWIAVVMGLVFRRRL